MNLRLLQLGDSALPIGGYSHSWGLEAAVERGVVRDPASLEQWTRDWLRHSVAPAEGVVLANVCRAVPQQDWERVVEANELLAVSLTPVTLRHASRDMGEQMLSLAEGWDWARDVVAAARRVRPLARSDEARNGAAPSTPREWHHASAFAILATAAGADAAEALAVYLHQAAVGVIGAGVKAVPIGHTHGQQVLARLHDDIAALARDFATRDLDTAGSFGPAHEMLCHAQSRLYTRLFRS
jgi:urease accessory protein